MEYYLSDENLKYDKFFHEKISADKEGWLEPFFFEFFFAFKKGLKFLEFLFLFFFF